MQNLYQYQDDDGTLHIQYSTPDGNYVFVTLGDQGITIHDAYELKVVNQVVNQIEVQIVPPSKKCPICRAPLENRPDRPHCPNCGLVEQ